MSTQRLWARHYQDEWWSRAGDPGLPYWLRVAALAYGSHLDNGHASFKRGDVAVVLGEPGQPYNRVGRAIEQAVERRWLEDGSWWGCLIVPRRAIRKGPLSTPKPCRRCAQHVADPPLSGGLGGPSSPPDGGSGLRTSHSVAGSERAPLYLFCPTQGDPKRKEA